MAGWSLSSNQVGFIEIICTGSFHEFLPVIKLLAESAVTSTGKEVAFNVVVFVPSFVHASAAFINLTIDDTNSTFFSFTDADRNPPSWAAITPSAPCVYCSAKPKTDRIHNQTWHDGGVGSAGSFTFQGAYRFGLSSCRSNGLPGSAVYIYGIDLATPGNISFTMDDDTTIRYYNGTQQFVFDALFFMAADLT
jgi:hypothetical protein